MKFSGIENEPILLLPAVQLDVLVFHASCSDKNGNIQIGRRRELATLAHASKKVFVTVEKILDTDFFEDELSASTCLPALYVDGISIVKNGAWPCKLPGVYESDNEEIKKYSIAAKTKSTFDQYMKSFLKS
jgi:glutaconate CoA-transferase subunit A